MIHQNQHSTTTCAYNEGMPHNVYIRNVHVLQSKKSLLDAPACTDVYPTRQPSLNISDTVLIICITSVKTEASLRLCGHRRFRLDWDSISSTPPTLVNFKYSFQPTAALQGHLKMSLTVSNIPLGILLPLRHP